MTTITLEVPDELAAQLNAVQDHLPALLYEVLVSARNNKAVGSLSRGRIHPAYREMVDFLASGPTTEQIIDHKPSQDLQERAAELLEKNREEGLIGDEEVELDGFEQVNQLMSLLKARARLTNP
jgi:hypothetical protein